MSELVTAELVVRVARYNNLPIRADRAALLAGVLEPALAKFRLLQTSKYEHLTPATTFRVPPPVPTATP